MKRQIITFLLGIALTAPTVSMATCYEMEQYYSEVTTFHIPEYYEYDSNIGIIITMAKRDVALGDIYRYEVIIPKVIGGEANPDFDRLFAIVLKYFDVKIKDNIISKICVDGVAAANAQLNLQSIRVYAQQYFQ